MTKPVCGVCSKYLKKEECPRAEYKDRERNRIACLPTDKSCELFAPWKKQSKDKKPVVYAPFVELEDEHLCEQYFDGEDVGYLEYDNKSGEVTKTLSIELSEKSYEPIDNADVREGLVLLPSGIEEYDNEEKLIEDVKAFLNKWHEPPNEEARILDSLYVPLTYINDLVPQVPYLRALAPWGKGKSTWIQTVGSPCYRALILAGCNTEKSFCRMMHIWRGTALIDEADFSDSTLYSFVTKTLNVGYDKMTGYYRRSAEKNPYKTDLYYVYGPKLLATRKTYKDPALESRCLTMIVRQNVKPMPLFRMDSFLEEAQTLRNRLILWRFRNYHKIKEAAQRLEEPSIAKEVYGDGNIASRIKQIILPLWLVGKDKMKTTLQQLARREDERMKAEDTDYLLQIQAKAACKALIDAAEEESEDHMVNLGMKVNLHSRGIYELALDQITTKVLLEQGCKEDTMTRRDKIGLSRQLKRIFESNLGFHIKIGRARKRIVRVPQYWVRDSEDLTTYCDDVEASHTHSPSSPDSPQRGV